MTENLALRTYHPAEATAVARVHLRSFEGFFLTFLGERFLCLYYRSIIDLGQIGYVAEVDGEPVGFVTGIDNGFGFYQKLLLRRGLQFAWCAAAAAMKRPSIIPRLARALVKRTPEEPDNKRSVTLTSIAVLPDCPVRGVGHALVSRFVEEARRRGFERVILETDADNNDRVNGFYVKEGFRLRRTYSTPEGRRLNEYERDL